MNIELTYEQIEAITQQYLFETYHHLDYSDDPNLEALRDSFRDVIRYCTSHSDVRLKELGE